MIKIAAENWSTLAVDASRVRSPTDLGTKIRPGNILSVLEAATGRKTAERLRVRPLLIQLIVGRKCAGIYRRITGYDLS
jgi:hypothetical protein